MLSKVGATLVIGAMAAAQGAAPISVDGNAITLTAIIGVALMTGKAIQEVKQLRADVTRILKKVFPEEYGE